MPVVRAFPFLGSMHMSPSRATPNPDLEDRPVPTTLFARLGTPFAVIAISVFGGLLAGAPLYGQETSGEDGPATARIEAMVGVIDGFPGSSGNVAMLVGLQTAIPRRSRVRLMIATTYIRTSDTGFRCCGSDPRLVYGAEAVVLGVGLEARVFETHSRSLAFDLQYNPMWTHAIPRGSQPAFDPGPTHWNRIMQVASGGATWRWQASDRFSGLLGLRGYFLPIALAFGTVPEPTLSLTLGLGL